MYNEPINFSELRVADKEDKATHVQFFSYKEFVLVENEGFNFYKKYCDQTSYLQNRDDNDNVTYPNYGEIYKGIVPVVIRINLRFKGQFDMIEDDAFILHMVKEAQECIAKLFELTDVKDTDLVPELIAAEFEDTPYYHAGETIVKYRIQFPFCRTKHENVLYRFYPLLMERVRQNDLLQHLPADFRDALSITWNDIINPDEIQSPLPLYFSVTDRLSTCAFLQHIFPKLPVDLEKYEYEQDIRTTFFTPEDHLYFSEKYKPGEHGAEYQNFYPLFFSIYYGNWETPCIPENEMLPKTPMPIFEKEKKGVCDRGRYLDIAKTMLDILKEDKTLMNNFKEVIGRSIYGSDILDNNRPSKEGEALFIETKRYTDEKEFNTRKTRIEYQDMKYQPVTYTYKTLCYLVKMFMKEDFKRWHEEWYRSAFIHAQQNIKETLRLAEMIYRVLFLDFIVAEFKKGIWFSFDGNVWRENDSTAMIDKKIIENIRPIIEKRIAAHVRERDRETDDRRKRDFTMDIETMEKLQQKLSTNKGISDMINLLKKLFFDENFSKNKNKNIYVTGVKNGVLEAKATHLYFRIGLPEDYITKQCSVYREMISPSHPNREFLMNWFRQMWPEPIVRWYLKYKASNFIGRNLNKIFLLITGGADNGKSQLVSLNESLFGEYFVDIDAAAFTKRKQSASAATEEWEDARDARDMNINEPSEGFLSDMLKKIAGGDKFRSRGNYEKGGMVNSTFKITAVMNQLIEMEGDRAMRRRARIIEIKCTYVEEKYLPKTVEEQKKKRIYKMDPDLPNKIPYMADAYLSILEEYYAIYKKEGLDTPKEMQVVIDRYWKQYDYIDKFSDEYIDTRDITGAVLEESSQVSVNDLYLLFEGWYRRFNPNKSVPGLTKFRYILNQSVPMNDDQTMCLGIRNKKTINDNSEFMNGLI